LYTYRRHLENNVLPRLGDVRLGEATTPLIDKVVGSIKAEVGAPSARTCRSIVSGVMGLAVRYGAVDFNTAREVDRIEAPPKSAPRALTETERVLWFQQLNQDERAVRADLPDLTMFMLATGVRIAESLGVLWSQVSFERSEVEISHQVNRIAGQGLVRRSTKSSAGERTLKLPTWAVSMLRARFMPGVRLDEPVFPDSLGGFRDPNNVRRDLRNARSPIGNETRRQLGDTLRSARRKAGLTHDAVAARLGWSKNKLSLIETARVRVSVEHVTLLAETYRVNRSERPALLELAATAAQVSDADTLVWVTSHNFRKTTATILDEAGHSARQVADQLGHSKPSMTQDVYMARKLANPAAAEALERALPDLRED
jgi:integrase